MQNFKVFLESSTIHGLTYISTTRKYAKLFWILTVIGGFTGAVCLIYQSFQSWADNPITTTIDTLPITEITFPKVTVCPPKDTYTDLNYDLTMAENMTLSDDKRNELAVYAMEILADHISNRIIANLTILKDDDRYYNWYHGYTQMTLPQPKKIKMAKKDYDYDISYLLSTSAKSGSVTSRYFGEKFDADKVETSVYYQLDIDTPDRVHPGHRKGRTISMHFDIERVGMDDLPSGFDRYWNSGCGSSFKLAPNKQYSCSYYRQVSLHDVKQLKLTMMPGFNVTWYYIGLQNEDRWWAKFTENEEDILEPYVRFANILQHKSIDNDIQRVWKLLKKMQSQNYFENKECNSNDGLYDVNYRKEQVLEVAKLMNLTSSADRLENMTKKTMEEAAEMFFYLNSCPVTMKPLIVFFKDLFLNQSPQMIILTLSRLMKASTENTLLKDLAKEILLKVLLTLNLT